MTKYNTLKALYNDINGNETNFLQKNKLTLAELREIQTSFNNIARGTASSTINSKVADIFKKYQFTVTAEGIGWTIA